MNSQINIANEKKMSSDLKTQKKMYVHLKLIENDH